MFTGIIKELGVVKENKGRSLTVRARLRARLGDSVAVNGACLTVVSGKGGALGFDVSAETKRLTNLAALRPGDRVNLEPALRAGELLSGHLVSGHIDARGKILERKPLPGGFERMTFSLPEALRGLVARKGSVAVDGVSLTVNAASGAGFDVALIPETLRRTTLGRKRPGDAVNLEADLIARYVASALSARSRRSQ